MNTRKPRLTEVSNKLLDVEVAKIPTNPDHPGSLLSFAKAFLVYDDIRQNDQLLKIHMDDGKTECERLLLEFIKENKIEAWAAVPQWSEGPADDRQGDKIYLLTAVAIGSGPAADQIDWVEETKNVTTH